MSPSGAGDGTGGRPGVDNERDRDNRASLSSLDDYMNDNYHKTV
jgi:hypothetical protein